MHSAGDAGCGAAGEVDGRVKATKTTADSEASTALDAVAGPGSGDMARRRSKLSLEVHIAGLVTY